MRRTVKPENRPHHDRPDESVTTHPAFAVVSSSRVSGGAHLFQSDFQHQYYRILRIQRAELHRHLANDWVHSTEAVVEIAMSEAQWNHFVTNPNQEGTPCTLEQIGVEMVPGLPRPSNRRKTFTVEAQQAAQEAFNRLDELIAKLGDAKLSQKGRDDLAKQAESIRSSLQSSMPFILEQFQEHMEETVEKAKVEIDAYANRNAIPGALADHAIRPIPGESAIQEAPATRRIKRG